MRLRAHSPFRSGPTPLLLETSSDLVTWQTVATVETPGSSNVVSQTLGATPVVKLFRVRQ